MRTVLNRRMFLKGTSALFAATQADFLARFGKAAETDTVADRPYAHHSAQVAFLQQALQQADAGPVTRTEPDRDEGAMAVGKLAKPLV